MHLGAINFWKFFLNYKSLFKTTELRDFMDDLSIDNSESDFLSVAIFYFWTVSRSSNFDISFWTSLFFSSNSSFWTVSWAFYSTIILKSSNIFLYLILNWLYYSVCFVTAADSYFNLVWNSILLSSFFDLS